MARPLNLQNIPIMTTPNIMPTNSAAWCGRDQERTDLNHLLTTTAISMILTTTGATAATTEEQVKAELMSRGYE